MALYLLAVLPGDEINNQVKVWKEYMLERFQCRVAMKSPAHITLVPPFHLAAEEVLSLQPLLKTFVQDISSFEVELNNFAAFVPRVIYVDVLPSKPLNLLKQALENQLIANGFRIKKEQSVFHPHVTIANRDLKKEDFPAAWLYFKTRNYKARFTVSAISLLKHNGQVWENAFETRLH